MKIKKIVLTAFLIFTAGLLFATEFTVKGDKYDITATYDDTSYPGEAFFVRLTIESHKKNIKLNIKANAKLSGKKTIAKADFYYLQPNAKAKNVTEMLVGLPMWSWQAVEDNTKITVTYSINDEEESSFELPVTIAPKKYPHERIELDAKLSDLIGNPNPEKKEQSRVLNEQLATVNPEDVYEYTGFIRPTTGTRITSEFGQTRTFVYSNGKEAPSYHAGLDFGVPTGTEIVACGAGKVVMARWRIVTGYSVIIEHLPGFYSIYYHLSELKCKEGDIVKKGDLVALSGATGLATGPHLHWEVRMNSVCLEPDSFVKNYAYQPTEESIK
nr:peptidoglycan DD-metalloendopeptidase family protein [uncultured Treponema sp.]